MDEISKDKLNTYYTIYGGKQKESKKARHFSNTAWKHIKTAMGNFIHEGQETKQMAEVFFKMLEQKLKLNERNEPPSEEEVKEALEQLKDVGRIGFFASFSLLPGGAFSLLGLELLARKFGIKNFSFLPSSFRKKFDQNTDNKSPREQPGKTKL